SIAAACDRVMLLRGGAIEAFGPSGEVLRRPLTDKGADRGAQRNTVVTGSFATMIRGTPHNVRLGS
ncbi:type I secretion system permease/ATPase, partial [Mesorhizobium sp. M1E.F.Ca.ET.063.01.1.1]